MSPEQAVDEALNVLAAQFDLREMHTLDSHVALAVHGLEQPAVVGALGLYLVGLLAGIVQTDLRLSTLLLDATPEGRARLTADVEAVLEPDPDANTGARLVFNQNIRDPWIAEGVGHALLAVRQRAATPCLSGPVAALTVPHGKPSQQGLDLFAIYDDGGWPAMALGEAKATAAGGSGRLSEAIGFFRDVQEGNRDVDIRMQVVLLVNSLPAELEARLSAGFWHQRASFLPIIAHGDVVAMNTSRPALRNIGRTAAAKRVIFCRPNAYAEFFGNVANAMRNSVSVVVP